MYLCGIRSDQFSLPTGVKKESTPSCKERDIRKDLQETSQKGVRNNERDRKEKSYLTEIASRKFQQLANL